MNGLLLLYDTAVSYVNELNIDASSSSLREIRANGSWKEYVQLAKTDFLARGTGVGYTEDIM